MNDRKQQKLNKLFTKFANETQASSFAVENLFNKVISVVSESEDQLASPKEIKQNED